MKTFSRLSLATASFAAVLLLSPQAFAETSSPIPLAIDAPGENTVATFHAEGAQLYECKPDADNRLVWQFREPIATLLLDGKTVGTHYAGPNWQHADGSGVRAKSVNSVPGHSPNDIPWLRLEVTGQRGNGTLTQVTTVQRINTKGGALKGSCESAGTFRSVPYSADYVFLRKGE